MNVGVDIGSLGRVASSGFFSSSGFFGAAVGDGEADGSCVLAAELDGVCGWPATHNGVRISKQDTDNEINILLNESFAAARADVDISGSSS
ncbi:MAG TPA: hypothetical protein VGP85_25245 [Pyrinomonadaceae bacterium]|nr:hypothetical protein [Pyrinomonadaceae bacterium]